MTVDTLIPADELCAETDQADMESSLEPHLGSIDSDVGGGISGASIEGVDESTNPARTPPPAAETDVEEGASPHVRIGGLQRPFTTKALLAWLEERTGAPVAADAFWINAIKTHCIVSFGSAVEASQCVRRLAGSQFPAGNPKVLEITFSETIASDAASSPVPGSSIAVPTVLPASAQAGSASVDRAPAGLAADGLTVVLRKPLATGRAGVDPALVRRSVSVTERPALATLQGDFASGFTTARFKGEAGAGRSGDSGVAEGRKRGRQAEEAGPNLDVLFKKTKCAPHLYWLPVPDAVVSRRRARVAKGPASPVVR